MLSFTRKSLNSISRRLKELVLAAVEPGEDLSQYDVLVTVSVRVLDFVVSFIFCSRGSLTESSNLTLGPLSGWGISNVLRDGCGRIWNGRW